MASDNIYYSLDEIAGIIRKLGSDKVILITSRPLLKKLRWAVDKIKQLSPAEVELILIPDGEKAKDWNGLQKLLAKFFSLKLGKRSVVLALGGGTVSDLAGLACSLCHRGITNINIPTTLLAQIDASTGGKTAINFNGYKNSVGTFYNPAAVIIDIRFSESVEDELFVEGLAEIIKYGLILDKKILSILARESFAALRRKKILKDLILRSLAVKKYFAKKDPKDRGIRHALNFGHTIGHALELKYKLRHGKAVLLGMLRELMICESLKITKPKVRKRLMGILNHLGIVLDPKKYEISIAAVSGDKKISGAEIDLPVIKKPGKVKLARIKLSIFIAAAKKL